MSLHESRRSPARRIEEIQLLQGLLTQRLYVNEHDRRLLSIPGTDADKRRSNHAREHVELSFDRNRKKRHRFCDNALIDSPAEPKTPGIVKVTAIAHPMPEG